ncbi:MAG: hypothetical protein SGBAC_009690 [Bacillariaceae sp.]
MGKVQSLPMSHFEATNAGWSSEDCILRNRTTKSAKTLNNILTFWVVGKGCTWKVGTSKYYQLDQCFLNESPRYRRLRMTSQKNNGEPVALLQYQPSKKKLKIGVGSYEIYTYQPNYEGQEPFQEPDANNVSIYFKAELVPTQFQGFRWEYRVLNNTTGLKTLKPLCIIKARPRGYKFHCIYYNAATATADADAVAVAVATKKTVIAETIQPNTNRYNDWGETFPIHCCAGVDEIALLLMSTALEDHRDRLNDANRGKSARFFPSDNGYAPPLERTRNVQGFTQGFCS